MQCSFESLGQSEFRQASQVSKRGERERSNQSCLAIGA